MSYQFWPVQEWEGGVESASFDFSISENTCIPNDLVAAKEKLEKESDALENSKRAANEGSISNKPTQYVAKRIQPYYSLMLGGGSGFGQSAYKSHGSFLFTDFGHCIYVTRLFCGVFVVTYSLSNAPSVLRQTRHVIRMTVG